MRTRCRDVPASSLVFLVQSSEDPGDENQKPADDEKEGVERNRRVPDRKSDRTRVPRQRIPPEVVHGTDRDHDQANQDRNYSHRLRPLILRPGYSPPPLPSKNRTRGQGSGLVGVTVLAGKGLRAITRGTTTVDGDSPATILQSPDRVERADTVAVGVKDGPR